MKIYFWRCYNCKCSQVWIHFYLCECVMAMDFLLLLKLTSMIWFCVVVCCLCVNVNASNRTEKKARIIRNRIDGEKKSFYLPFVCVFCYYHVYLFILCALCAVHVYAICYSFHTDWSKSFDLKSSCTGYLTQSIVIYWWHSFSSLFIFFLLLSS